MVRVRIHCRFSQYGGFAIIGLSLIGFFSYPIRVQGIDLSLSIIIVPYALAFFFGVASLLGRRWALLPLAVISFLGMLLNIWESISGPNQKDIFEVGLFMLVLILIDLTPENFTARI